MSTFVYTALALALSITVLFGIRLMNSPKTAVKGNQIGAVCMTLAIIITMWKDGTLSMIGIWVSMMIGGSIGLWMATRVKMIQMPQMVALLNGLGGAASALVAMLVLIDTGADTLFVMTTAGLALAIGALTLSGSLIAAGKLHQVLDSKPVIFNRHSALCMGNIAFLLLILFAMMVGNSTKPVFFTLFMLLGALGFGVLFTVRVGGADMPITISLLNSLSGVAGSIAGMSIGDALLVAVGGIVGASGLLLTQVMCRGMNRSLMDILLGKTTTTGKKSASAPASAPAPKSESAGAPAPAAPAKVEPEKDSLAVRLEQAKNVVIIPGYGMALAQAQHKVRDLAETFEKRGAQVAYAIHPVAGRMPGHMNVLLAEANVDYEKLMEMDAANEALQKADLAVIIGANDVVNPAANTAEGTPIYGMPVLMADAAKHVIICNFDTKPGYAGVENPLYTSDKTTMLLGDANETVAQLLTVLSSAGASAPAAAPAADSGSDLGRLMGQAKNVVIIPGYGMALAQAQHKVRDLADTFEKRGAQVSYAIHPVAGRMPGHMNVLLAEADVDYEKLMEMEPANEALQKADLAVIVGANDVVNPAANTAEGTPIYGMPVLMADAAKHVIICNFDTKPGYAGVENPLYTSDKATLLLGDANETVAQLLTVLSSAGASAPAAAPAADSGSDLGRLMGQAKNVVIIPGYGMALAQAQHKVRALAEAFEKRGAKVEYAIHPVAGRMPGHMNVLLAEADVDYEKLLEMDPANEALQKADLAVIVGANDVVNPAANTAEGTPIYGMPVLMADAAKHVIICNFDTKPGYAGVENPLYTSDKTTMLLGDANETVQQLLTVLSSAGASAPAAAPAEAPAAADSGSDLEQIVKQAKNVVIIPGYGMALAQAQHKVRELAETFEKRGAQVDYAIHPVAGRMPGHMNVLLAEANVDYEKLLEMDPANEALQKADLAVIIGANDVVNPAANTAEGTPIYGMPVLMADAAKHVIICNFDTKPGYAGVENPLYTSDKTTLLLGDANETVAQLIGKVR